MIVSLNQSSFTASRSLSTSIGLRKPNATALWF